MPNTTYAALSNQAIYSAIVVLTLAMIAFVTDLAQTAPTRQRVVRQERSLIHSGGAGAPLASETAGPVSKPRRWAAVGMSLTWLGGLLLTAGVSLRGLSVMRVPWGNMYEFATTGSVLVLGLYLALSLRHDMRWLGTFVVGPVLLMLGLGVTVYYTQASQLLPSLQSFWLVIHVSVAILSAALFTMAFSITLLYLAKSRHEDHPGASPNFLDALPSAVSLERRAYSLHVAAFPLWTFTLIAGAIWAQEAWGAYWQWDPKEVWTFVIWVVYAAYLHARATSGWSPRSAAYIALVGYGCILINYMVVNVYFVGMHSYSGL